MTGTPELAGELDHSPQEAALSCVKPRQLPAGRSQEPPDGQNPSHCVPASLIVPLAFEATLMGPAAARLPI
jgi:hypothetical protein